MKKSKFGKLPSGDRLEICKKSPNFKEGKFQNFSLTPELAEGYTMLGLTYNQFFKKAPRRSPVDPIPSIKTDLHQLPIDQDVLIWFGHSSYFIQIEGKRILVDPVFSGNASPVPATNKSFKGTDIYTVADLPDIDYLFISHDHYDHLDYKTIKKLKSKVHTIICGLGVGSHFEYWGYDKNRIIEKDWHDTVQLDNGFTVYFTPARHFSGRGLTRNTTLWCSFLLQTPSIKIYIGGDSGYDTHYKQIGEQFGPIDLAILDNGQYDAAWPLIHMHPEEVLQATLDLKAKRLLPVHSSKFVMANHPWDEPLKKITELNKKTNIPLVTPLIGAPVNLKDSHQEFTQWWNDIE
ncbi:MAG TPA: MBL fold metallo-hydrolase [Flavobacterium sp.]|nr:MBL fold metallo-hydrolase [Flavobacterium sp.]